MLGSCSKAPLMTCHNPKILSNLHLTVWFIATAMKTRQAAVAEGYKVFVLLLLMILYADSVNGEESWMTASRSFL